MRESGDEGAPIVTKGGPIAESFHEIAKELARNVALRNADMDQTKIVEVKR